MAKFFPAIEEIMESQMEKPTAGEMKLLAMLQGLEDKYSIYFQPHINYMHPDIIIVKEGCGVLIIEVKDWDLTTYTFHKDKDVFGYLTVLNEEAKLKTPFQQVIEYKSELFQACPEMNRARIKEKKIFGTIRTAVYFSKASTYEIKNLFGNNNQFTQTDEGEKRYLKYIAYWSSDDSDANLLGQVKKQLGRHSFFRQEFFTEVTAVLKPSEEWLEQMQPFTLDSNQKALAESVPGHRVRVRGVAGSGKTLVIAQKAINCFKAKKEKVLILMYNVTLRNYIRDKIAQNTRDMSQHQRMRAFEIAHFDGFLIDIADQYNLKGVKPDHYYDERTKTIDWKRYHDEFMAVIRNMKNHIQPYSTILIDEAQDYESEWFRFVEEIFADEQTEMLVVADEKQNLYQKNQPESKDQEQILYGKEETRKEKLSREKNYPIIPGFTGRWRKLDKSYRLAGVLTDLAFCFQKEFMENEYTVDESLHQTSIFDNLGTKQYFRIAEGKKSNREIIRIISEFRKSGDQKSPNDICVLTTNASMIRGLDFAMRKEFGERSTTTMVETREEYIALCGEYQVDPNDYTAVREKRELVKDLDSIQKSKKLAFNMNTGSMKICTIQSFKGWEIDTVVLILGKEMKDSHELIYTALTRAKMNLIVIDLGNETYGTFFQKMIQDS